MNRHSRPLPAFGRMPLDRIGPEDVAAWFDAASKDKPGAANRAFEILRATMFRAEERGLRERGSNPCLGIAKNPRNHFARFLDADELARLGRALDTGEAEWPEAVAAIRLLALTGCRRSEVLNLRWRDIGEDAINLADSKTGPRAVPLGEAARALIEALPGARKTDAFLFPRHAGGRGEWSLTNCWRTVCADAELGRLRLHDLRHTAASQAIMAGENLPLVGKLLGHKRHRTTADYAHLADTHLVEAAERVGEEGGCVRRSGLWNAHRSTGSRRWLAGERRAPLSRRHGTRLRTGRPSDRRADRPKGPAGTGWSLHQHRCREQVMFAHVAPPRRPGVGFPEDRINQFVGRQFPNRTCPLGSIVHASPPRRPHSPPAPPRGERRP